MLAPRRVVRSRGRERGRWLALSAAASVAAVALVAWLAFSPQPGFNPVTVAVAPQRAAASPVQEVVVRVPPPQTANDYLLAHQGYSPWLSLQGVAPYVRAVSDASIERKPR